LAKKIKFEFISRLKQHLIPKSLFCWSHTDLNATAVSEA